MAKLVKGAPTLNSFILLNHTKCSILLFLLKYVSTGCSIQPPFALGKCFMETAKDYVFCLIFGFVTVFLFCLPSPLYASFAYSFLIVIF